MEVQITAHYYLACVILIIAILNNCCQTTGKAGGEAAQPNVLAVSGRDDIWLLLDVLYLAHCFISMSGTSEPESHTSPPLTL